MCPRFCSAGAGSASVWGQGWEVGPVHGWTVLIHGTTFPNNLQKLLGWFQLQPNISSSAAPRLAWYPEETQLPVVKLRQDWSQSIRQQKPPASPWRLWERVVLDEQEYDLLSDPSPGQGSAESCVKGSFLLV